MGFLSGLLDLLFPPSCIFCRSVLKKGEEGICSGCVRGLDYTKDGGRRTGEHFTACYAPLFYENKVRESLMRFKFKEATGYAKYYGRLIAACIREHLKGSYDLISWVPLSEKRLKKRGYDQAMLLAMASALELGDVAVETLIKHTDVPAQSGVGNAQDRRENIIGVFAACDPDLIADKRILLVDDIITTGATLSECARTLLEAGAKEVFCVTLAAAKDKT